MKGQIRYKGFISNNYLSITCLVGNQSTDPLGHLTPQMVGQLTPPLPCSQCSPSAPDEGQLTPPPSSPLLPPISPPASFPMKVNWGCQLTHMKGVSWPTSCGISSLRGSVDWKSFGGSNHICMYTDRENIIHFLGTILSLEQNLSNIHFYNEIKTWRWKFNKVGNRILWEMDWSDWELFMRTDCKSLDKNHLYK